MADDYEIMRLLLAAMHKVLSADGREGFPRFVPCSASFAVAIALELQRGNAFVRCWPTIMTKTGARCPELVRRLEIARQRGLVANVDDGLVLEIMLHPVDAEGILGRYPDFRCQAETFARTYFRKAALARPGLKS